MSIIIEGAKGIKCRKCGRPATVRVKYAKLNLCSEHFAEYLESRLEKTLEKYGMLRGVKKILLGVSGGKDSMSLAYMLSKLREKHGFELFLLHIDLGNSVYSEESIRVVKEACNELKVPCIILSLKDLIGYTLPEIVERVKRPPCSICGMLKRYILNMVGLELGVDAVSLGHHLDDILSFTMKDILLQDLISMTSMKPISPGIPGVLIERIKPLYEIYEDDLRAYAASRRIRIVEIQCPFKYNDPFMAAARKMLDELEEYAPGFKISLARRLQNILDYLPVRKEEIKPCKYCGMPSKTGICGVCKLTERLTGRPLGGEIRSKIRAILESMGLKTRVVQA